MRISDWSSDVCSSDLVTRIVQPIAQFMAAFPANLFFPVAVSAIVMFRLDPDVWLSPLMILGTQWYILFNVIAGAAAMPGELRDIGPTLRIGGWPWWRRAALPGPRAEKGRGGQAG